MVYPEKIISEVRGIVGGGKEQVLRIYTKTMLSIKNLTKVSSARSSRGRPCPLPISNNCRICMWLRDKGHGESEGKIKIQSEK